MLCGCVVDPQTVQLDISGWFFLILADLLSSFLSREERLYDRMNILISPVKNINKSHFFFSPPLWTIRLAAALPLVRDAATGNELSQRAWLNLRLIMWCHSNQTQMRLLN